ncbi:DUF2505 domain-containing protein [Actinopolymorpha sp. NPDC004070]|uniref:DUF2505 domain-containing protein n=1 Tax=Actinopolymorpha sp. NPDC004070 TaxID=3154548 RepID=UPI0033AC2A74
MDLHRECSYAAPPDTVYAMLTNESFIRHRVEKAHALSYDIDVTDGSGGARTTTHQSLPAKVPDFVRKFVGERIELDEVIDWGAPGPDGSRTGDLKVEIANAPVSMRGKIRLVPDAGGSATKQIVDADLKASVPIIGKKIEQAAAPAVMAGLDGMEDLGRDWLASQR